MIDAAALLAAHAKAEGWGKAAPPAQAAKCSEILQAMAGGLQVNARLWRGNGECNVRAEGQCTGDQQACPFRR